VAHVPVIRFPGMGRIDFRTIFHFIPSDLFCLCLKLVYNRMWFQDIGYEVNPKTASATQRFLPSRQRGVSPIFT
jgi:hypothetical protein